MIQIQEKPPFWTDNGLKRLGQIIKTSLESRGISQNEAAQRIFEKTGFYITKGGLNKVLNATTKMPEFNTLVAIAASGLVVDENGKPLTIYDFIDIASESSTTMTFKELLQYELDRRGWTLRQFADDNELDYEDLAEIFDGQPPQEYLIIGLASQLTNPRTGEYFVYPQEVVDFCQIKQIAPNRGVDRGLGEHISNGVC